MSTLEQRKPKIDKTHPSKVLFGANPDRRISAEDLAFIRRLPDFDLTMLISDIHDHGWTIARNTLKSQKQCAARGLIQLLPESLMTTRDTHDVK